jgi:A/G-specific adenine glycosylase
LKRTTSKAADRVFNEFIEKFPDIKSLYVADISLIEEVLKPIGLYSQRAKGLKEAAEFLVNEYGSDFPKDLEKLLQIPHIGPYTAGAIFSIGMNKPAPMVDSNVYRVISRVFKDLLSEKPTQKEVIQLINTLIPEKEFKYFNWGIIDLGSLVCTYRGCCKEDCPVKSFCNTYFESKYKDINN